jgi:FkbH-like protein
MDVLVISDFNAELVSRYLSADRDAPICAGVTAPYGQVYQSLGLDSPDGHDQAAFIWTRPEGVVPAYLRLLEAAPVTDDELLAGVRTFAAAIADLAARRKVVLVASWVSSQAGRGLGMLDWTTGGHASTHARMNLALTDVLGPITNVFVLDAQRWLDAAQPARDPKSWFAAKCPFTEAACRAAARDVKAAIRGITGLARKLIVLDLDDTLWGGIAGEEGWQAIRLGGHDTIGEAYADFQRALKTLSRRGVAIALVSKNEEAVALEAFDKHPEMVLRRSDLAGWRINWSDKAQNILELSRELNLGLEAIVFIDDSAAERGRVREALPEVFVPDWPKDPARFGGALRDLDCFDTPAITSEDRARAVMYTQHRERTQSLAACSSVEEWLQSLSVRVTIEPVGDGNLKRSVQLANKTNQMNLRSRRLTEAELKTWLAVSPHRAAVTLTVADRFGDLGLTGFLSWQAAAEEVEITDFVLSCRAMGRHVENLMTHLVVEAARRAGRRTVLARLITTPRNLPCLKFWRGSGFTEPESGVFVWDAAEPYPAPAFIAMSTAGDVLQP